MKKFKEILENIILGSVVILLIFAMLVVPLVILYGILVAMLAGIIVFLFLAYNIDKDY